MTVWDKLFFIITLGSLVIAVMLARVEIHDLHNDVNLCIIGNG